MKETPKESQIRDNFQPGVLSKEGFLGDDVRHIHDIIRVDLQNLADLGWSREDLADALQKWINIGKKGLEGEVESGAYTVLTRWDRGLGPCPFGEPGLYPKMVTWVTQKESGRTLRFSQLSVHLIRKHGFFGGLGSSFRIDPADAVALAAASAQSEQGY